MRKERACGDGLIVRFKIMIFIFIMIFSLILASASAHPGRIDSNGGHYCWTNCEKWGLEYGEYHYHNRRITPAPTPIVIVTPTTSSNLAVTPTPTLTAQVGKWIKKADTPSVGGYGEAVAGTNNNIYAVRNLNASSNPEFWCYDPSTDSWSSIGTSGLPLGAFRSGTALTWDHGDYIYALLGARYSDSNRRLFYRYSITNNIWEQLADTPHAQGAGNAMTWSGYDNYIYAILGSAEHGTAFARYKYNSWEVLALNPSWTVTDDGASLVWAGGEYLYVLRGEYAETVPNGDFARYHILSQTWVDMKEIPESEGVGDGASLLWVVEYSDDIFALGGGDVYENPGYNFYRYSISTESWEYLELESIPYPIGYYVGNRLGSAKGHIYYWQGAPSTWLGGGNTFFMFEFESAPPTNITVAANRTNVSIVTSPITPTPVEFTVMLGSTPVSGATVTLSGAAAGTGITTPDGKVVIMVSPTRNGTIVATATHGSNTNTTALTAKGDVSGDNRVSITDALFIAQYTAGIRVLDSNTLVFADVSGDGRASITDALFIAQATAGIPDRPVPKQGN